MTEISRSRRWIPIVTVLFVIVAVVGTVIWNRMAPDKQTKKERRPSGFAEIASEIGIRFHMDFLPSEQGVIPFKINLYDHGCGLAVGDFDADGYDDIYFVNQLGPCALYRNKGDGTFEDVTKKSGVGLGDRVCVSAAWCDYDNDGFPDLYVASTRGGNVMFHNNGDGTFKDVTKAAGVECLAHSQTVAFFDFNNDGHPDLFVSNTAEWTLNKSSDGRFFRGPESFWEMAKSLPEKHRLFQNKGDGTFKDVTTQAGLGGKGWGGDVAIFDFDEDGYLDLFVTNMFGASQLYRNTRDGKFVDVTKSMFGKTSWGAIGAKAFDFNNDGKLDLFITDMHSDMWLPKEFDPSLVPAGGLGKKYSKVMGYYFERVADGPDLDKQFATTFGIDYESVVFGNVMLKHNPGGKYLEVSDQANLETFWPWGIATGDFDNDGFEDVFIPSGMGFPFAYWPNSLMMNKGDESFVNRAGEVGLDPPPGGNMHAQPIANRPAARSSRAAVVADFRQIGKLDLVVNNFNDYAHYFRNDYADRNYVQFRLTGAMRSSDSGKPASGKSNRDAIGALVTIHSGDEVMLRQVHTAGGYLAQSSQTLHFGLGKRSKVDWVEIRWPSGRRQRIDNPDINKLHLIAEDDAPPVKQ